MTTMSNAVIVLQASQEDIRTALEELSTEWALAGITTPVIDVNGDIDPDALTELRERF